MPPKTRITKEMVTAAALAVVRETGAESLNARAVAQRLGCSTQPVMYHFATMEELKRAVCAQADQLHGEYLLTPSATGGDPLMEMGLNYIRFAVRETHLFRLLFQSGWASGNSLMEMLDAPELAPVLSAMGEAMGLGPEQTREIFVTLALFVHGYASLLANTPMKYDEEQIKTHLERVYTGAILAIEEEKP